MRLNEYIYNVNYQGTDRELCALEVKSLFGLTIDKKVFITDKKIDPSISPYLRNRIDVMYKTDTFEELLECIELNEIIADGFNVKYLQISKDDIYYEKRKELCMEIGLRINGEPLYKNPKITYTISFYESSFYLGLLNVNSNEWKKHNDRPYSYSSSLNINIAKVLANIASNGDTSKKIIDACCGVGTVLFEGFFAGYNISGRELNEKVSENARINLRHFNYPPNVVTGDIQDITDNYDASILDLPYGISSDTNKEYQMMLIRNGIRIAKKLVLVSSEDIAEELAKEKILVTDYCKVTKNKNREFARYVWVCEGL